jgi:hypothetical protein
MPASLGGGTTVIRISRAADAGLHNATDGLATTRRDGGGDEGGALPYISTL